MTEHLTSERAQEYLDDELPTAQRRAVEDHLHHCAACRADVAAYRTIIAGAVHVGAAGHRPADGWRGVEARIRRPPRGRHAALRVAAIGIIAIPAAVIGYASGSLDPLLPHAARTAATQPLPQEAEYRSIAALLEAELEALRAEGSGQLADMERELDRIDGEIRTVRRQLNRNPAGVLLLDAIVKLHAQRIRTLDSGLWLLAGE